MKNVGSLPKQMHLRILEPLRNQRLHFRILHPLGHLLLEFRVIGVLGHLLLEFGVIGQLLLHLEESIGTARFWGP